MWKEYLGTALLLTFASIETAAAMPAAPHGARPAQLIEPIGYWRRGPLYLDCTFYNAPIGYYGNPWCERGWVSDAERPVGFYRPPSSGWRIPLYRAPRYDYGGPAWQVPPPYPR